MNNLQEKAKSTSKSEETAKQIYDAILDANIICETGERAGYPELKDKVTGIVIITFAGKGSASHIIGHISLGRLVIDIQNVINQYTEKLTHAI